MPRGRRERTPRRRAGPRQHRGEGPRRGRGRHRAAGSPAPDAMAGRPRRHDRDGRRRPPRHPGRPAAVSGRRAPRPPPRPRARRRGGGDLRDGGDGDAARPRRRRRCSRVRVVRPARTAADRLDAGAPAQPVRRPHRPSRRRPGVGGEAPPPARERARAPRASVVQPPGVRGRVAGSRRRRASTRSRRGPVCSTRTRGSRGARCWTTSASAATSFLRWSMPERSSERPPRAGSPRPSPVRASRWRATTTWSPPCPGAASPHDRYHVSMGTAEVLLRVLDGPIPFAARARLADYLINSVRHVVPESTSSSPG